MPEPPRFWLRLLRFLTPEEGGGLIGDLTESHAHRATEDGRDAAAGWFRDEVLASVPHLLRWRVRIGVRSALRGALVAVGASAVWFVTVYAGVGILSGRSAVLGGMSMVTYLTLWVFGAALVSGVALRRITPRLHDLERHVPGLVVASVVLLAADQPATAAAQLTVLCVALVGSAVGTASLPRRLA